MNHVIDASVVTKWFVDEDGSDRAASVRGGASAPDLIFAEVGNALWKLRRKEGLSDAGFAARIEALKGAPIEITPIADLLPAAARLAAELDHPIHDCFYLALAMREGAAVVTADRRFHDAVATRRYLKRHIRML